MTLEELEYANRERLPICLNENHSFHMTKEEIIPHILETEGVGNPYWEKRRENIIIHNMTMRCDENGVLTVERSERDDCGFTSDCFDICNDVILSERILELL